MHLPHTLLRRREVRYLCAGAASELIEYIGFAGLLAVTHLLVFSNTIGFLLGIASGFLFHKYWSFAGVQQFKTRQQLAGYLTLAAVNLGMANLLIVVFVRGLGLAPLIAKLVSMAIIALWSYLIFKKVIFRQQP